MSFYMLNVFFACKADGRRIVNVDSCTWFVFSRTSLGNLRPNTISAQMQVCQ